MFTSWFSLNADRYFKYVILKISSFLSVFFTMQIRYAYDILIENKYKHKSIFYFVNNHMEGKRKNRPSYLKKNKLKKKKQEGLWNRTGKENYYRVV